MGVTLWLIVGSFVSYVPMSATEMQNIYIAQIMFYGGMSLALQLIAIVLLSVGIFRKAAEQRK